MARIKSVRILIIVGFSLCYSNLLCQSLDRNTLLDSVYVLQKSDLNSKEKLINRRDRGLSSPGDKYQPVILNKILKGIPKESGVYGADSSFFLNSDFDSFIMKVAADSIRNYQLVVIHNLFKVFLMTLDSNLNRIDFILLVQHNPTTSNPGNAEFSRGIRTSFVGNTFTQTYFNQTKSRGDQKMHEEITAIKRFKIDSKGKFSKLN